MKDDRLLSIAEVADYLGINERTVRRRIISREASLSNGRRRDLLSAIASTARMLNQHPKDLPVDIARLRPLLAQVHPVQQGISEKRLANIRADLKSALRRASKGPRPKKSPSYETTEAWRGVLARLPHAWQRHILARFVRFCCEQNIEPIDVTDEVLARFRTALDLSDLAKDPDKTALSVMRACNGAVRATSPSLCRLTPAPRRDRV
jgi:hypothetical protein